MNALRPASLTFACVIAIAGSLFFVQQRRLQALRTASAAEPARAVAVPEDTGPPQPPRQTSPPPKTPTETPPAPTEVDGSRLVERMVAALGEKRAALEQAGDAAAAALWTERLGILLDLTPEQSESARTAFHQLMVEARAAFVSPDLDAAARKRTLAAMEQRLAEYLSRQFGEEKASLFRTAERARQEAGVEYQASEALQSVARIVDLPPAQKDALYAAFSEKARSQTSTFAPGQLKPQFTYAFHEGPRVDDPFSLARTVLTPEQAALYEKTRTSEAREQQRAMHTAVGVMRDVFQQALGDAPATQAVPK